MKKEVKNWLEQAEHDIEVAEYNLNGNMLDAAAFYSQQAVEKALKSLYILKFEELWKVHDLVRIAKRIQAPTKIVELKDFKQKICQKYAIKEMILFGSQVTGEADENSDIDLIVVGDEFKGKSPLKRSFKLYLEWTLDYPVDFLCYTPEEFEEKRKEISIVRHAIREGVVI